MPRSVVDITHVIAFLAHFLLHWRVILVVDYASPICVYTLYMVYSIHGIGYKQKKRKNLEKSTIVKFIKT